MSQFIAANVASAALVTSNPTNVLIAGVGLFPVVLAKTGLTVFSCRLGS